MNERTDFRDWEHASAFIKKLDADWQKEIDATAARRKIRYHDIDEAEVKKKLKPHESYIPRRVADTNIRREMPVWISYVTQSPRVGVFKPLSGKVVDTGPLEIEFSDFVKYEGWEIPFFKVIDGCMTHGVDFIKTTFDVKSLPPSPVRGEIDEAAVGDKAGEIEGILPGTTETDTFDLQPGKYVLFCNVSGHYARGEATMLEVV